MRMKASDGTCAEERAKPRHRTSYQEDSRWLTTRLALLGAGRENRHQTSNDAQLTCKEADYILFKKHSHFTSPVLCVIDIMKRFTK